MAHHGKNAHGKNAHGKNVQGRNSRGLLTAAGAAGLMLAAALLPIGTQAQQAPPEPVDLDVVHRIRTEAIDNSKVMDHVFQLTEVIGHRLTNSPGFFKAAAWVEKQMKEWGIDAKQETWGPFGRGWDYSYVSARIVEPVSTPLIGVPLAWAPGTDGKVRGEVTVANIQNKGDFDKYKGKLKGKILFLGAGRELALNMTSPGTRFSDQELAQLATGQPAGRGRGGAPGSKALNPDRGKGRGGPDGDNGSNADRQREFQNQLNEFLNAEGVAMVVRIGGGNSEVGTVFAQAAGSRDKKDPLPPPTIALTPEHYNRVLRLLDNEIPVEMEFQVDARFYDDRTDSVNVVAEIPGTTKRDELVMIGAHLDSWHGGTGATDNAAGSAVMIEVMRILKEMEKQTGHGLKRTVRMVLWGGEEQGLLGSRAYVKEHFADRADMKLKAEHEKMSGYFNIDNGSGKVRGAYLQGNDRMRPIFEAWLKPFEDLGVTTISIRNTGGTDHTSFDAVGLPGFQFIQDWLDYNTRTHHSNMDVYDRVQKDDLTQIAAVVASVVYHAAQRDQMLPREPLPPAQPPTPVAGTTTGGPAN